MDLPSGRENLSRSPEKKLPRLVYDCYFTHPNAMGSRVFLLNKKVSNTCHYMEIKEYIVDPIGILGEYLIICYRML